MTYSNTNESSGYFENEESITHLPDKTNERNYDFRWRSSKPPSGDYVYKEKSFTFPDLDYDETLCIWSDELTELIAKQTNICSFQKRGKTIQVTKEENS